MKKITAVLVLLFALKLIAQVKDILPYQPSPVLLNNVIPQMRNPGFWISRCDNPDSLMMNDAQIADFNRRANRQGTVTRIAEHSIAISGRSIRTQINNIHNSLRRRSLYDGNGQRLNARYFQDIYVQENTSAIPSSIRVRFALPISFCDQRLLPSSDNLNAKPLDLEFDELQNSGFDLGTALVLYHNSRDGNWAFGANAQSSGWIRLDTVATYERAVWKAWLEDTNRVYVLSARCDIWFDAEQRDYAGSVRMGSSFPFLGENQSHLRIKIPVRNRDGSSGFREAFISKADARRKTLPYTQRNVLNQAFKMLNHSYGWGDMNGDWDCSSMLASIYSCFGIKLPRNGGSQAEAGSISHIFEQDIADTLKCEVVAQKAIPGITLLQFPGHIMLYIGSYEGNPYALHNIWGYRSPVDDNRQNVFVINRTVVSDLSLGEGSVKGSLLKRLYRLSNILDGE